MVDFPKVPYMATIGIPSALSHFVSIHSNMFLVEDGQKTAENIFQKIDE
jgi:hypothetical protein